MVGSASVGPRSTAARGDRRSSSSSSSTRCSARAFRFRCSPSTTCSRRSGASAICEAPTTSRWEPTCGVGAERTIGFTAGHLRERTAGPFYTHRVDPTHSHVIFKNLALLEPLGSRDVRVSFPLEIPDSAATEQVRATFHGEPYAVINPGAAWPNKRWPADRFGALAATLRDRFGLRSVVLWGPNEQPLAQQVSASSDGAADPAPSTSMSDLFAIARPARILISGDTGPLHIAAAVGTPLVALFGPTRAERNGPWSTADCVVARTGTCSCLYKRRCRRSAACINDIQLPEVVDAVERRLSTTNGTI